MRDEILKWVVSVLLLGITAAIIYGIVRMTQIL